MGGRHRNLEDRRGKLVLPEQDLPDPSDDRIAELRLSNRQVARRDPLRDKTSPGPEFRLRHVSSPRLRFLKTYHGGRASSRGVLRFDEKVAFITGAGGGIGSQVARSFSAAGAKVFLTDARIEAVRRVVDEFTSAGGDAAAERMDVTSQAEVDSVVAKAEALFGGIDILVNCAGIIDVHPFDEISESAWDRVMDVNAKGTFLCCQSVARGMIRRMDGSSSGGGGKIVNIASSYGKIGMPWYLHYCASKFAVIGITKTLALEVARYGINVNAVCPADVETEMLLSEFKRHAERRGHHRVPGARRIHGRLSPWEAGLAFGHRKRRALSRVTRG